MPQTPSTEFAGAGPAATLDPNSDHTNMLADCTEAHAALQVDQTIPAFKESSCEA